MDIFTVIVICIVAFVIFSLCGYCCKRNKGGVVTGPPVAAVTSTYITATPIVHPPYPTDVRHPTPQPVPQPMSMPQPAHRGVGFGDYPVGYQTAPYPPAGGQHMAPYPPAQVAPPPSYNEAIAQPGVPPPPVSEHYAKQSPYNPHY